MPPEHTSNESIWSPKHLPLTTGSILAVTLVAFQGLAVATIAPVLADELDGRDLYGWIFTAFILTNIIGTVVAGREVDRRPPASVFYSALAIFAIGCVIAGSAPDIWMLFFGRAVQGLGAGAIFATIYAIVSGAYPDDLRPSMLAALSSAWIVPSLVGPVISGFIADTFSWRYVFWGLIPILAIIAPLTWPSYRKVRLEFDPSAALGSTRRVRQALLLAIGTGLFLAGLDVRPVWIGAIVTIAGLALLIPMLQRLLPQGTFSARPMLGAALANRALCFGAFGVTETYMVFSLTEFGGVSTSAAGVVLTVGSLTWTAGSIIQARLDRKTGAPGRPARARTGASLLLAGMGLIWGTIVVFDTIWVIVAVIGWLTAGLGMGLAYTTSAAIAFAHAPRGQDGMVSSSTLLGDLFASSIGVGLGGVLLAFSISRGWSTPTGAALALSLAIIMLTFAWISARRMVIAKGAVATV